MVLMLKCMVHVFLKAVSFGLCGWLLRGLQLSEKCSTGFGAGNCPKTTCEAHRTPVACALFDRRE